jgi:hypothetical protein
MAAWFVPIAARKGQQGRHGEVKDKIHVEPP